MVDALVKGLGTAVVPYLLLLVVPVMGRMSDPVAEVRQPATATFAPIVALLPLAQVTCSGSLSWHQHSLCAAHVSLKSHQRRQTSLFIYLVSERNAIAFACLAAAVSDTSQPLSQVHVTGNRLIVF